MQDHAAADESDAGNESLDDAARCRAVSSRLPELKADDGDERCAKLDECVGAEAGRLQ